MSKNAETPIMTLNEIRELRKRHDLSSEDAWILYELKRWFLNNVHTLSTEDDYAFRTEINELHKALEALKKK